MRMLFAVVLAAGLAFAAGAQPKGANPLLPDLIFDPEAAEDNIIDATTTPGRLFFRFEASIANLGPGELRINSTGVDGPEGDGRKTVVHRIDDDEGGFVNVPLPNFRYNPTTRRMEVEGWVAYRIREWLPGDGVGPILRDDQKPVVNITSSSIYNLGDFTPVLQRISANGPNHGVSKGWTDIYLRTMEFQWVDVTGLPQGDYWLELENDVPDTIAESNENNNIVRIKVTLDHANMPLTQGDVNDDQAVDAVDIQIVINAALGTPATPLMADINGDGSVDAVDIQFAINVALGIDQPLD